MTHTCHACGQPLPKPQDLILHDDSRCIMYDGKVSDSLTRLEYELAQVLARRFGRFCNAEVLCDQMYRHPDDPPLTLNNSIASHISRMRPKLSPLGLEIIGARGSDLGWKIIRASDASDIASQSSPPNTVTA